MDSTLRKLLGARLLSERVQVKDWNEVEAARKAKIDPKTVNRIERGLNYEWDSLEKYAEALGRPIHLWIHELMLTDTRLQGGSKETQRAVDQAAAGHTFRNDSSGERGPGESPDAPPSRPKTGTES